MCNARARVCVCVFLEKKEGGGTKRSKGKGHKSKKKLEKKKCVVFIFFFKGVVRMYHTGGWGGWAFNVLGYDAPSQTFSVKVSTFSLSRTLLSSRFFSLTLSLSLTHSLSFSLSFFPLYFLFLPPSSYSHCLVFSMASVGRAAGGSWKRY